MTYLEIVAKYAADRGRRKAAISLAAAQIERIQTQLAELKEQRNSLRKDGEIGCNITRESHRLSMQENTLKKELAAAEERKAAALLGDEGLKQLINAL